MRSKDLLISGIPLLFLISLIIVAVRPRANTVETEEPSSISSPLKLREEKSTPPVKIDKEKVAKE